MANKDQESGGVTSSGDRQAESADTVSDKVFPMGRGPNDFGTHGGKAKGKGFGAGPEVTGGDTSKP